MSVPVYPSYVFVNGRLLPQSEASWPVNDLAVLRGYGVFDFFLVKDGHPLFFEDHWARLQHSAGSLHLKVPFGPEDACRMIKMLHEKMPFSFAGCRITLTGGCSPDGYQPGETANCLVTLNPLPFFPETLSVAGIGLMTHTYRRPFATVKSIDYVTGIMMLPMARKKGFQEVLYVQDGAISECPRSNVFAVSRDNTLITPREGVLMGITRKRILGHAASIMKVEERPVTLTELIEAKEVFISSTTKGIWTVSNIDGQVIADGKPGEYARRLYALLVEEMNGQPMI